MRILLSLSLIIVGLLSTGYWLFGWFEFAHINGVIIKPPTGVWMGMTGAICLLRCYRHRFPTDLAVFVLVGLGILQIPAAMAAYVFAPEYASNIMTIVAFCTLWSAFLLRLIKPANSTWIRYIYFIPMLIGASGFLGHLSGIHVMYFAFDNTASPMAVLTSVCLMIAGALGFAQDRTEGDK